MPPFSPHPLTSAAVVLGKQRIVRGDHFTATISLKEPCALEVGLRFGIGRLLGQGIVLEVIS